MGVARKPVVYNSSTGKREVIQAGDYITEVDIPTKTNQDSTPHVPGTVVYLFAATQVKRAKANAIGTMPAIALAKTTVANGADGPYQNGGEIVLTTAQWDAINDNPAGGGLVFHTEYFASNVTAGNITDIKPTTGVHQPILWATSTTNADIRIGEDMLL